MILDPVLVPPHLINLFQTSYYVQRVCDVVFEAEKQHTYSVVHLVVLRHLQYSLKEGLSFSELGKVSYKK